MMKFGDNCKTKTSRTADWEANTIHYVQFDENFITHEALEDLNTRLLRIMVNYAKRSYENDEDYLSKLIEDDIKKILKFSILDRSKDNVQLYANCKQLAKLLPTVDGYTSQRPITPPVSVLKYQLPGIQYGIDCAPMIPIQAIKFHNKKVAEKMEEYRDRFDPLCKILELDKNQPRKSKY
ncbi:hypothetical protein SNEBB_009713 [Seison nebaliae]|nr:hypothetical protein SNEBB_009713 [Seison nebaliae]